MLGSSSGKQSLYSYPRFTWQTVVPDTRRISKLDVSDSFLQGVELFLSCADSLESSPLYVNDAIEYASYYLAAKADDCYKRALKEDSLGNRVAAAVGSFGRDSFRCG